MSCILGKNKRLQQHPPDFLWLLPRLLLSQISTQAECASHFIVFILRNILVFHPLHISIALAYGTTKSFALKSVYIRITWKDFKEITAI